MTGQTIPPHWEEIGLILLAAGRGTRFGRDKLAAPLGGKPVIDHAATVLAALPLACRIAVRLAGAAYPAPAGFSAAVVAGDNPPQSAALAAGIAALIEATAGGPELAAILVALGDMPLITRAHLEALRAGYDGSGPVCSMVDGARCPPVLFPATLAATLARQGDGGQDSGGRALLTTARTVAAPRAILLDVDTPADLAEAERYLSARPAD